MVVLSAGLLREAFAALSASFIYASSAALPVASGAELVGVMTGATNAQCLVYLPPCFTQAERIARALSVSCFSASAGGMGSSAECKRAKTALLFGFA